MQQEQLIETQDEIRGIFGETEKYAANIRVLKEQYWAMSGPERLAWVDSNCDSSDQFLKLNFLLRMGDHLEAGRERGRLLRAYHRANGKFPSHEEKEKNIRKLGIWLMDQRNAKTKKKKKGGATFHSEYLQDAIDAGFPDMFEQRSFKNTAIEKFKACVAVFEKTGKWPTSSSKDEEIRKLGNWLGTMRMCYKSPDRRCGDTTLFPEVLDLAVSLGYSDVFVPKRSFAKQNELRRKILLTNPSYPPYIKA